MLLPCLVTNEPMSIRSRYASQLPLKFTFFFLQKKMSTGVQPSSFLRQLTSAQKSSV